MLKVFICVEVQRQVMWERKSPVQVDRLAAICSLNVSRVEVANNWKYCRGDTMQTVNQIDLIKSFLLNTNLQNYTCEFVFFLPLFNCGPDVKTNKTMDAIRMMLYCFFFPSTFIIF